MAPPDGCRVTEEGLPLFNVLVAAASMRIAMDADPQAETARGLSAQPQLLAVPPAAKPDNF